MTEAAAGAVYGGRYPVGAAVFFLPRTGREGILRVVASNFESCCLCW